MINITNGNKKIRVTEGAYKQIFAKKGYKPIDEYNDFQEPTIEVETPVKVEQPAADVPVVKVEKTEEELQAETDKILLETPLSELTKDELKRVAVLKGIDTSKANSIKEAREIIKKHMATE